jgi:drug/metabolite transporter (DMT)-like permease
MIRQQRGVIAALISALLFSLSAPLGKLLLQDIPPLLLAGLLYLGCGLGLAALTSFRRLVSRHDPTCVESKLRGLDYLYLGGAVLAGGVAAPIFLLYGLLTVSAGTASLLLNSEAILTVFIAALIFKESVTKWVWGAFSFMVAAALLLTIKSETAFWQLEPGTTLVILACFMWALDNNLTRKIAHRDPVSIARIKGLAAGVTSLTAGFFMGDFLPAPETMLPALLLGALSYGASLVFFIYALRHLGTARTVVCFSAAPILGALASIFILGEPITQRLILAAIMTVCSIGFLVRENHDHEHEHEAVFHEHRHRHDEHHQHEHPGDWQEPHNHGHFHAALLHSHAHTPDLHHSHRYHQTFGN